MVTLIKNKAEEVKLWISSFTPPDPSPSAVKGYINRRWPDLDAEIKQNIFIVALGETFKLFGLRIVTEAEGRAVIDNTFRTAARLAQPQTDFSKRATSRNQSRERPCTISTHAAATLATRRAMMNWRAAARAWRK